MCTNKPKLLVEEAEKLCVESNACRYSYFKNALLNLTDSQHSGTSNQALPEHRNLRRKEIYQ